MSSLRVLVTGSSGFVGGALVKRLACEAAIQVVAAQRRPTAVRVAGIETLLLGDLEEAHFSPAHFTGIDVVVHAAARVHVMHDASDEPLLQYRRINVAGTLALARAAAAAGVRRFIFLSTIKVYGETSRPGRPFTAGDAPAPQDDYGVSKLEAEIALQALATETGMELVIVRPPLVYGPGVGANFLSMMRWLQRGVPLPLGGIRNRRSLVALPNLVDLIVRCLRHPAAANQILLVSDGVDVSTSDLLVRLGRSLDVPARLLPLPQLLMPVLLRIIGRGHIWRRLGGTLQVDIRETCRLLDWRPPVSLEAALLATARHFQGRP